MDLTVETKDYKLCYQRLEMSYIHNFISEKIRKDAEIFANYVLTKKEVRGLIEKIKTCDFPSNEQREKFVNELSNMEMLMCGDEKASFCFW